ncbi:TPA: hypothetical protein J1556_002655 [Escherichia coli]|nr:hypothetical protein [Escherichia coli]HBA6952297.1 hypothetical protein [Escherichia coli]HBA7008760.1 hypothetical protein [Escherichia coli]HBB0103443.1 hypothetical protein [Escherichia coli]
MVISYDDGFLLNWLLSHGFSSSDDNKNNLNLMIYATIKELNLNDLSELEVEQLDNYFDKRRNYWIFDSL